MIFVKFDIVWRLCDVIDVSLTMLQVPVATDSDVGRQLVMQVVRDLGFTPVDMGPLRMARDIERMPSEFFTEWRGACMVVGILFTVSYIIAIFK